MNDSPSRVPWSLAGLLPWLGGPTEQARLVRFLAVGLINLCFGVTLFAGLILLGIPHTPALLLATVGGVLFNFQTTGGLVFGSRDWRRLGRFVLVYALVYLLNAAALDWLVAAGWAPIPAQMLLVLPVAGMTFVGFRLLVFLV